MGLRVAFGALLFYNVFMEGKYREFIEKFQKTKNKIKLDQQTTMRVGGDADLFLVIGSSQELIKAVTLARKLKIPYFILGGGSNIIFSDKRGFKISYGIS